MSIIENESAIKRQSLAPGILMEKFQEKDKGITYYIIKIELKLFNILDFTVDFTGSVNVRFESQNSLIKTTKIPPYSKVEIARLVLEKKWNIKTKFKFTLQLPPIDMQRQYVDPVYFKLKKEIADSENLKTIDFASMPDDVTFTYFAKNNTQFLDQDFLPINSSIDTSEKEIIQKYETLIHWRRTNDILNAENTENKRENDYQLFMNGINPMDIKQGKLGNCWLLSSIASVAEHPKLIERIILTKSYNNFGYYRLKLCKMAKWKTIVIDDYIPCFPFGETIFSRNSEKEIWVLLLEKAFAKLFGSYNRLIGGDCQQGLIDLTGCPTISLDLTSEKMKEKIKSGELWRMIVEAEKLQYIGTAGTKEFNSEKNQKGLVREHAYSILRIVEVENAKFGIIGGTDSTTKLINLRNPWGVFEWNGDWSDSSDRWTPELMDFICPDIKMGDGNFWMSYEDFLDNFDVLTVCKISGWHELKIKGKFVKGIDQSNEKISHFCSRWYYEIDIRQKSKIIFGIHQEDERCEGVKETRPYLDIGVAVLSYKEGVYRLVDFKNTDFSRERFLELVLEPGVYYLVPRSVGNCLSFNYELCQTAGDFSSRNTIVTSVIRDIFEKYDIVANEFLSFKELKAFYDYIGLSLTEEQYNGLVNKFGKKEFSNVELEGLSEKGFINLFYSLISNKPVKYIMELFDKLGYNEKLFSHRTRIFMISIHSEKPINISIKDALVDNIDFTTTKLIIKKFGISIDENAQDRKGQDEPEAEGFYFFNEFSK
jgi:hypothetical protein